MCVMIACERGGVGGGGAEDGGCDDDDNDDDDDDDDDASAAVVTCRPIVISVDMSASFFCINWFAARGEPNCLRSSTYLLHVTSGTKIQQ